MTRRFPKRTFVALGKLPAARLGLSPGRSAELQLRQAWTRVTGRRLAGRAIPNGVRRGVLEIKMTEIDEAWARTLDELLPRLAAAVAADHPGLGIRSVRLTDPAGAPLGEPHPIERVLPVRSEKSTRTSRHPGGREAVDLDRLMRAYLSRSVDRSTD